MRLYLCAPAENGGPPIVLATARGAGVKEVRDPEAAFFAAAAPWFAEHGPLRVMLSGMIGSTFGWCEAPYVCCPASPDDLAGSVVRFTVRGIEIAIVPGLRCTSIFGLPDVMRGEEMQIFGWLRAARPAADAHHLLCLPGTHAKWVLTRGDAVLSFFTSMQGELHEILLSHSLLGRTVGAASGNLDVTAFDDGVDRVHADPTLAAGHALFSMRSRVVLGELPAAAARDYLSGLLIGAELRDATRALAARGLPNAPVVLIGAEALVTLYARALDRIGSAAICVTDADASVAGLGALVSPTSLVA